MKRLTKDKAELLALQFRATIGASMAEPISVKTVEKAQYYHNVSTSF